MIGQVLSIFSQVLDGLKTLNFTFGDINFTAYQGLIGVAVLTISCKIVFSNIFEKIPHFNGVLDNIRPLEVQADINARKDLKRRELNYMSWKFENEIRRGER